MVSVVSETELVRCPQGVGRFAWGFEVMWCGWVYVLMFAGGVMGWVGWWGGCVGCDLYTGVCVCTHA